MTAKEKLLSEAPSWSEAQATAALQAAERAVEEWGSLSEFHEVAFGESMRRLAEQESAAGQKPWKREDLA